MERGKRESEASESRRADSHEAAIAFGRKFGLGCFTFVAGFWSGGMVGVLIGKFVEGAKRRPDCGGLPICNWFIYAGIGAAIGALTLPALVLWKLRRPVAPRTREGG